MLNNYFCDTNVNLIKSTKTFENVEQYNHQNTVTACTKLCNNIVISLKEELDTISK